MEKSDDGYIVVETVGAFVPFVLLVVSILSLVNIVTMQVRIHYALSQTAGTLSMYCYILEAVGVADEVAAMEKRATGFDTTMTDILGGINTLSGSGGGVTEVTRMFDAAESIAGDPVDMLKNFANHELSTLRNTISAALVKPLFQRYLASSTMTGTWYLVNLGVTDFAITDCTIIDNKDKVKLTAEYEVDYTFGALKLPFTPTLHISQTVVTKAWLGGEGERYRG